MGLNFYGNDYSSSGGGGPIAGQQYVELLRQHRPRLEWLEGPAEHVLEYVIEGERHQVYYPSLFSLHQRLSVASELGVGASVWDLGQGLDFFMDLL